MTMRPKDIRARSNLENDAMSYNIRHLGWCEFWEDRSGASYQPEIDYHREKINEHWSNAIGWASR